MAEFGTGKTIFILAIVVGCFAILWPKIFYPMLLTSISGTPPHQSVPPVDIPDASNQCCDVIFETDVTAIKVLTEMCGHILFAEDTGQQLHVGHLPKAVIDKCRAEVLSACGLDIASVIRDNVRLTKNYKQILDDIRSYNNSACLKRNFGLQLSLLGTPRQMRLFTEKTARHLRPERPAHLHPDMLHPALREKGRAIPQHNPQKPLSVGAITGLDGSPPRQPGQPMPGMRPPMGGAGHVVSAPKGSGTMGIVMPLYTVGIVVFFVYTIMKMIFKKTDDRSKYSEFGIDPELRRMMFGAAAMEECAAAAQHAVTREEKRRVSPEPPHVNGYRAPTTAEQRPSSKLVVTAISGLIAEVDHQILASEAKNKLNLIKEEERKSDTEEAEESVEKLHEPQVKESPVEQDTAMVETVEEPDEAHDDVAQDFKDEEIRELETEEDELKDDVAIETAVDDTKEDERIEEEQHEDKITNGHVTQSERTVSPVQHILEEGSGKVTVLGMETTAQCEGGQKWSGRPPTPDTPPRCTTPILPLYAIEQFTPPPPPPPPPPSHYRWARPPTPPTPPRSVTPLSHFTAAPHSYLLESSGAVQAGQHGILVSDSECEALPVPPGDQDIETDDEEAPPVILSGKMTLSVISLPESTPSTDQQHSTTPASPVIPRRMMQVSPAQLEEHVLDEHVDTTGPTPVLDDADHVKTAAEPEMVVNGENEALNEPCKPEEHLTNGGVLQDEFTATNYTTAKENKVNERGSSGGGGGPRGRASGGNVSRHIRHRRRARRGGRH